MSRGIQPMYGIFFILLYLILILAPLFITLVFGLPGEYGFLFDFGRVLALSAFCVIALQPVLVSRIKWIEARFGLDMLSRFHRVMGLVALVMLLPHPLMLAFGGIGSRLLISFDLPWYVLLGKATLIFLLVQVGLGIFWENAGLSFERWRVSHWALAPVIIILGFIHSWYAGSDLDYTAMQVYWIFILVLAVSAYTWRKILKPGRLPLFIVSAVDRESHNVWTIKLKPPESDTIYQYMPGQFQFLTLYRDQSLPVEEHHWTISSSPSNSEFVSSTIKESGDFTSTIGETKPGDTALVEAPFGRFSYLLHPDEDHRVFIAGGIGITPLISMLRHMRDTESDSQVTLIYANRKERDLVFKEELDDMAQGNHPKLKIVYALSEPDKGWSGETGYVDDELLKRHCGDDLGAKYYYICGPPIMSDKVISALETLGVPRWKMRTERFSL
jgi:predicted ferric reductase